MFLFSHFTYLVQLLYLGKLSRPKYGATEIAGVDNVARAKKQGLKTREWTRRHEETGVDNAGVSDREK